jgi:hypothetical protein
MASVKVPKSLNAAGIRRVLNRRSKTSTRPRANAPTTAATAAGASPICKEISMPIGPPMPSLPAFIETEPDRYKPIAECSRSEIAAEAMSRLIEAQSLFDVAAALMQYLESAEADQ